MKMVSFKAKGGGRVCVNVDHVAMIEEDGSGAKIYVSAGAHMFTYSVDIPIATVLSAFDADAVDLDELKEVLKELAE